MRDRDQEDARAAARGFTDADHALALMERACEVSKPPRWVWREYRAIFMGRVWSKEPIRGGLYDTR